MVQTSTRRRNLMVVTVIIVVLVVASLIVFYRQPTTDQSITKLSVNVSLNQTEVIRGNNLQAQVNLTSIGKAENITLSSNTGSSGVNCTFEPARGISNFTSILTVYVPDSTPTGSAR
jgi:type II secretory pathway pseudopilin PulG